jgi:amino acid adenylation domain-containing protein
MTPTHSESVQPSATSSAESIAARVARLSPERRALLDSLLRNSERDRQGITSIQRRAGRDAIPVSFAQRRLWFLDQLVPGNAFYNVHGALRLRWPLTVEVLERSLNEIIRRHEVLRTTFEVVDDQPMQRVAAQLLIGVAVVDLQGLEAAAQEAEALRLATVEAQRPFDLERGPLLRARLLRLGEHEHVFLLTLHHIVTDGWSIGVLFRELEAIYAAYALGRDSPLAELPIQYADYALWQRGWLQGEVLDTQLKYWREQLAEVPVLQLPTDRPRPARPSFRGAYQPIELAQPLTARLRMLAQQEGATLFMTLLAAFKVLLQRYSGQDDVVVGTPIAGRNRTEVEGLIGFFVNSLVLRTVLDGALSFREVLGRVRRTALEAYTHQDIPFEMLVEKLQPQRDLSRNPFFQVTFQLLNLPGVGTARPGAMLHVDKGTAIFDLGITLWDTGTELRGGIEYNTDLFDAATMARMAGHYRVLLEGIVAGDGREAVGRLPLLSEAERRQVVEEWNATAVAREQGCLHQWFEAQVMRTPQALACMGGAEQLTYAQLNARANQLARHLRGLGVGPEVLVGIALERSAVLLVALLGVLKAGGAYVPLDPAYPGERLGYMLADAQARVLLTQASLVERVPAGSAQVLCVDTQWGDIEQHETGNLDVPVGDDQLAYVIYTSGSTGAPKGVCGEHRATLNRLQWMWRRYPFAPGERCCQKTVLGFVDAVWEIFGPLLRGVVTVLIAEPIVRDARRLVAALAEGEVTRIVLVPSLLRVLLDEHADLGARLPRLGHWISSGEVLPAELAQRFFERLPGRVLLNLYGSSEVAADATWHEVTPPVRPGAVPIGRPIDNKRVYKLDRHGPPVPVGVTGELYLAGAGVARGYLNRPELTAEKFLADPFGADAHGRLYKTGDLARYANDGTIEYVGRVDQQVKIRGCRIELGEIESVLKRHPGIGDAAVVDVEERAGERVLVAYVTAADGLAAPGPQTLRTWLQRSVPEYMVPASFVTLEALPQLANGKIDRRALQGRGLLPMAPRPAPEAPRNVVEQTVAQIWQALLGRETVGIHDNFFELGGHSLMAIQLTSRVRERFGADLRVQDFFEAPTIADQASAIETLRWARSPPSESEQTDARYDRGEI